MHKMIGVQSIVICINITDYVDTQKIHKTSQNMHIEDLNA